MRCVLSNRATLAPESWRDFPIRIAGLEGKTLSELEPEVFAELLQGDLLRRLRADWEYIREYWPHPHNALLSRGHYHEDLRCARGVTFSAPARPRTSVTTPPTHP